MQSINSIRFIKESGNTMIQTMDKFKKENNISEKVCYCGRLDPMARGQVLLLVGNNCKDMSKYLGCNKEYEFEILFGLSTDTDDPLGLVNNYYEYNKDEVNTYINKIKDFINIGRFQQYFHNYSSKRIDGKPMWEYTKNGNNIEKPSHEVEIFDIEYKLMKTYNFNDWKTYITNTINNIDKKNDFRQEQILNLYNTLSINNLYSLPIKINVSSGFYVRQLVADIKNSLNIIILTFDINRTNIYIK